MSQQPPEGWPEGTPKQPEWSDEKKKPGRRKKAKADPSLDWEYRGPPVEDPSRRVIRVRAGQRHIAVDEALAAMFDAGVPFYVRDRRLVRVVISKAKTWDGRVTSVPSLDEVPAPIIARALGQSAEWERMKADGEVIRIDPPREVVDQVAAMGEWPFPPISGVIGAPTMRPDGSILDHPGYDDATGLVLVAPPAMAPIKAHPTREDARASLDRLCLLLREFKFAAGEDGGVDKAVAISMLMTPVLRGALGGAVPMHVVQAPTAGTGKSYLQDVASALAVGERCAVITIAPDDPKETEKRLISAAIAGFPIIAIDNCNGILEGDFLAQVSERPLLQVRLLGFNKVFRIPNTFSVFANGNNIAVAADLVRRTVLCSLDANMENPAEQEFEDNPVEIILGNRGLFLRDCLTIARAYHCADYPDRLPRVPSYERWSDLVRSSLVWLDMEDPAGNADAIKADDPARSARLAIFGNWPLDLGIAYTASEIIEKAETFDSDPRSPTAGFVYPEFRNALLGVAKARGADRIDAPRLGWWLRTSSKVVIGGRKLLRSQKGHTAAWTMQVWKR